jgi:hypothetical protein
MKTRNILMISFTLLMTVGLVSPNYAQGMMNEEAVKETRITEAFNKIEADNHFNIIFEQTDDLKLIIETTSDFQNAVSTKVVNGVLRLSTTSTRSIKTLNAYISAPKINEIVLNGDASLKSKGSIQQYELILKTYGTSIIDLNVEVNDLTTELHGASEIILSGKAAHHFSELQGASKLLADRLSVDNTTIETNASSKAFVNTLNKLNITSNGNSKVEYNNKPESVNRKNTDRVYKEYSLDIDDIENSRLNLGNFDVRFRESRDSTHIKIGRHWFIVDEYGNAKYRRMYRNKFNSNWGGIHIGINGYLTPQNDFDYGDAYDYLDLNLAKSIRFDINFLEQNIRLTRNNKLGLVTGLGMEIRSYHFDHNVSLVGGDEEIQGYFNDGIYISKSKLAVTYLSLPFLLEYQTNSYRNRNSFHISAGMVFGLRIGSHTKLKFEEKNKEYLLLDPITGDPAYVKTSPNRKRYKEFGSFHLNPLKADAMFMIGWGWVNLYATYSITTLFKEGQGPELYPFSIGISLLKW